MHRIFLLSFTLLVAAPAVADEVARMGNLEMHCTVVPTLELTPEAAKDYNVEREAGRALLTVTLLKKAHGGKAEYQSGQVYAGATNLRNYISSIPILEVRKPDGVIYLGEFHVDTPDSLRFLVNANISGKPLRTEFSREFNAP